MGLHIARHRFLALSASLTLLMAFGAHRARAVDRIDAPHGDIVWDTYGVPHVFASNIVGLYYGFGFAQAKAHGNLILHLYGEARGRAAEYWGKSFETSDRYLLANGAWTRAQLWYSQQTPVMRGYLEAFAAGINAFAAEHPDELSQEVRVVLPVNGVDVIAHWEHVMEFQYLAPMARVYGAGGNTAGLTPAGSNAWAVAPAKAVGRHAMLLANPHLSWAPSFMTYFEAQLTAPGIEMYGATQVGFPVLRFCFNKDHALTNTVNPVTAATVYQLKASGGGYRYDGEVIPFETRTGSIKVKQPDGQVLDRTVELRSSVHDALTLGGSGAGTPARRCVFQ